MPVSNLPSDSVSSRPAPRQKGRLRRSLVGALFTAALAFWSSGARADALLDEALSFGGTIFHLQSGVPGVIVGAVHDGETAVFGFGETRRGNGIAPGGNTVLRVGSITKVFAGLMLAHAVARGETGLTAPVAPLLPGALGQAAARHPAIRLVDLATHAGGLPREVPHPEGPPDDPFAPITLDAFAGWLAENPLSFEPGRAISYSNFGFDLLSTALSTVGGKTYETLLKERITAPLGMNDTGFAVTDDMQGRLMTGHGFDGAPLPEVPSGHVITGSGGLRTTADDMLRWLEWHLDNGGPEAEARFIDHAAYVPRGQAQSVLAMDESGFMDAMGLGWVVMNATDTRPFILQKAGALQGQMSFVAIAPTRHTAVFVTINRFDFAAAEAMASFATQLLGTLANR
ncbi:D-alanyl-D-alanine-carboxypeptidase/endopeptidase AmpH [Oceaniglobus trochenteri]|uniref:D-alanyl-D-alanine- carboxypeptidase/endopeptidase AmpH n=1 Tax=Oceaniglobus trochenteri TaxID=2763260 RepID=UPI001CFFCBBD|nr:D-alanyl-D-alanine-carboxypeptidase/endopeptidase AmpH [Oceaniglobus trochenteri]